MPSARTSSITKASVAASRGVQKAPIREFGREINLLKDRNIVSQQNLLTIQGDTKKSAMS